MSILNCYFSTHLKPQEEHHYFSEDWERTRLLIEETLEHDLQAQSIDWLTEDALEDRDVAEHLEIKKANK